MAAIEPSQDILLGSGSTDHTSVPNETSPQPNSEQEWMRNHSNDLMSGIEFRRVNSNKLINFIAIEHKEMLESSSSFRIAVVVNDDNTFFLPPKQTFEEMIQAKRRQQMQLYAASNSTSMVSERADRNIRSAARRQSELDAARTSTSGRVDTQTSRSRNRSRRPSRPSRSSSSKKIPGQAPTKKAPSKAKSRSTSHSNDPDGASAPSTSKMSKTSSSSSIFMNAPDVSLASDPTGSKLITSMKELTRQNPSLAATDKKQIQSLLRSAEPGASIVLPDGKVIKKSRRGGARAGAGRKRNRPNSDLNSSRESGDTGDESRETIQQDDSTNHSFSSASQAVAPEQSP